jgi:hypothetical protein
MLRLNGRIICAQRKALRITNRLLKFGGKFIKSHKASLNNYHY